MANLLATKLHRPVLPLKRVQRPQLMHRLNDGLITGHQLTLVSAPPGFGKTLCISEWVSALDWPVAWLSLDPADDDPVRFFTYLIAALGKVHEPLGQEIGAVLRSGQLPPADIISTTLLNDVLTWEGRCLLVLDDFQVIQDRFILQVVEQLIANLPATLHLVLLTREDPSLPLARLRANNRLTEIRAGDLRFTDREADRFLNDVLGLALSPADSAALEDRTEGWIVGLQLAGISLRDRANPASFIATLSGSQRYILSYLTEEVLNRQPPEIQQFLLQTSILDKLNSAVCNAVTGRFDGAQLLDRLLNANLFLIPLDDEQRWFRYHHLFADLLRDRLVAQQKDQLAELHQRASHWYVQSGLVSEAIQHALAAEDYALAVQLIERQALATVMQGYVQTVNGWMQALPPAWQTHSPRTNLALAWMQALRGAYTLAIPYLDRVAASEKDPALEAEWLALQALLLNMRGQAAESRALTDRALDLAQPDDHHVQSLIQYARAGTDQLLDDYAQAVEAYQQAIRHGRAAGNSVAEMMSLSGLALLAFEHGQLHLAFEIAAPVSEREHRSESLPPISAVVYGVLGQVCYQWHQLDQARAHILRAIHLSALGGYNTGAIYYRVLHSRLLQLEGDRDAALGLIQQAIDLIPPGAPAAIREEVTCQQVRLALAQQRLAGAEAALQGYGFSFKETFVFPELETRRSFTSSLGLLINSALRTLLYRAQIRGEPASLAPGIELADRLIAAALQRQYLLVVVEALLVRGQMHAVLGDQQASRHDYARAVELAEPEGFLSIFVEDGSPIREGLADLLEPAQLQTASAAHVQRILAIFSVRAPATVIDKPAVSTVPVAREPAALIVPLTDREVDVLRLMAEGLKYEEIAARLFISVNTVRSHVKVIYGKLNVNNRTKAIAQARQLQLV